MPTWDACGASEAAVVFGVATDLSRCANTMTMSSMNGCKGNSDSLNNKEKCTKTINYAEEKQ